METALVRAQIQQHSFNCPYQAGSPKLLPNSNTADDAQVYEIDLQPGDVVVMATDGVFDNLFTSDLENIIGAFKTVNPPPPPSSPPIESAWRCVPMPLIFWTWTEFLGAKGTSLASEFSCTYHQVYSTAQRMNRSVHEDNKKTRQNPGGRINLLALWLPGSEMTMTFR